MRTTYYWAFMVALYFGYHWAIKEAGPLSVIFSLLEVLFAAGWHWATLGSKYWQENWETHVTVLEILSRMPKHSVTKVPEKRTWPIPLQEYPYSVTKINQLLNFALFFGWLYVLGFSVWSLCPFWGIPTLLSLIVLLCSLCFVEYRIRSGVA